MTPLSLDRPPQPQLLLGLTVKIAGDVTAGVASPADYAEVVTVGVASSANLAEVVTIGVASSAELAGDVTAVMASSADLAGVVIMFGRTTQDYRRNNCAQAYAVTVYLSFSVMADNWNSRAAYNRYCMRTSWDLSGDICVDITLPGVVVLDTTVVPDMVGLCL